MQFKCVLPLTLLILVYHSHFVFSEHILFLQTCASYSHRVAEWPLAAGLLAKGHKVTFISPYGYEVSKSMVNPNVTEITPKKLEEFMEQLLKENFDINHRSYGLVPPLFLVIDYFCYSACEALYKSTEIKDWLASDPKVDLVVGDVMADCSYGLSEKLGAKNALYMPIPMVTKHFESFGINPETHSVPDYDSSRQIPLTFLSRVMGTLLPLHYRFVEGIFYPWYKTLFQQELGLDLKADVDEIRDSTSLIIINGDYLSDYSRSLPPFVIKVPGSHIKKHGEHKPLTKEVQDFINSKGNKTDGFVYISFGTVAKAPNLPLELRAMFFNAIKSFPNIQFIWKWDGERPEGYPANMLPIRWVDQQDLLAHPRIKGFLTQAGRPSTQEALYNGVPTIAFPVLADQDFNAHRSANLGTSILMDFVGLSEEKLKDSISKLLTDDSYKERTVQLAKLAKDVPMDPVDTSVWWIEFALRHTKEELLLMKPMARHLTWYQKRELDVWLFILVCIVITLAIQYYVIKRIFNKFWGKKQAHSSSNGVNGVSKKLKAKKLD